MGTLLASLVLTLALAPIAWGATIVTTLHEDTWDTSAGYNRGTGHSNKGLARRLAWSFVAPGHVTTDGVDLPLGAHWATPDGAGETVTVALHANNGGEPDSVLQSVQVEAFRATICTACERGPCCTVSGTDNDVPLVRAAWPTVQGLTSGSTYWLVVSSPTTYIAWFNAIAPVLDATGPVCPQGRIGSGKISDDGGPWVTMYENHLYPTCSLAFRITSP